MMARVLTALAGVLVMALSASAAVITTDTVWEGDVTVAEDVLVAPGVTLTIVPGTRVRVAASETTKTDPEYLSPLTEITVRGALRVGGKREKPVVFSGESDRQGTWAGIVIDGGTATITGAVVSGAESGIEAITGTAVIEDVRLRGNRYGLVIQRGAAVTVSAVESTGNDYGFASVAGGSALPSGVKSVGNRKGDILTVPILPAPAAAPPGISMSGDPREIGDTVLLGETVWQGRLRVSGLVRVPEGALLAIAPGTIVEFTRRDTNGDGVGENGILVQGRLVAKGTAMQPIVFRSAEPVPRRGDWDAVNIMNSDGGQNIVENCRFEDAYRGLHFHFSDVAVHDSVFRNNYRGIQFQESLVDLSGNLFSGNGSGIQGRDSELRLYGNTFAGNQVGGNFYRIVLEATGNAFTGNYREGLRVRESVATVAANEFRGNRTGLLVSDSQYGSYARNLVSANGETGMAVRNSDSIDISGSYVIGNGITGLSVQDSSGGIRGNVFTDNGVRGIGSNGFSGDVSGNTFLANRKYAIEVDGPAPLAARANFWGTGAALSVVLDGSVEPGRGRIDRGEPLPAAAPVRWPLPTVPGETVWRGSVLVEGTPAVPRGSTLTLQPGATVRFSRGGGLAINGRLAVAGIAGEPVRFTSAGEGRPGEWDEVLLENAQGSTVTHAIFEHATWGIHSHFTDLVVTDSLFRDNYGGLRFRSGPVSVTGSRFTGNTIGIRSFRGNAMITGNDISGNDTGIFVREKGASLRVTGNNLAGNREWAMRSGDFNTEDVPAAANWWGTGDPTATIFDGRSEPGIGLILFEPPARAPVAGAGEGAPR